MYNCQCYLLDEGDWHIIAEAGYFGILQCLSPL